MLFAIVVLAVVGGGLAHIPSVRSVSSSKHGTAFLLTPDVRIIVKPTDAQSGSPSLLDFAHTFRDDLVSLSGWPLHPVQLGAPSLFSSAVYLTLDATANFTYLNGKPTAEGYEFSSTPTLYTIRARKPIGAWWGTRTLLQQFVVARGRNTSGVSIASASGLDAPGWEIRGAMLDVGRHYFTTSFLAELCAYASFFKISSLHLHASDNLWDPRFLYGVDWRKLYTGFRFRPPENSSIADLVPLRNESWSHRDFSVLQASCAARGVTLVPEIDAPGHSLVFTKWKPEIAISGQPDSLNLSHPETIPTIKNVWDEFLSWFTSDEVHVGADEYDRAYASVYNSYINDMASLASTRGKSVRVWGTGMPPAKPSISTNVTIQHWNFPDTIPIQLLQQGYQIINSEQAFLYLDGKTSYGGDQFPVSLDKDLLWRTNWAPNVFSASDPSNNTDATHPGLRGAALALWHDWGGNSTTPLDTFNQLSESLALLGERTWAGADALTRSEFDKIFPILKENAPGQDIARRSGIPASGVVIRVPHSAKLGPTHVSARSVGPPYSLSFTVTPRKPGGILFSGPDTRLHLDGLTFEDVQTGTFFPLNIRLPLNASTRVEIHATSNATWAVISGQTTYWETLLDMWGDYMQPANMSFVAPAESLGVDFVGTISNVLLQAH